MHARRLLVVGIALLSVAACAPATPGRDAGTGAPPQSQPRSSRALMMAVRYEPPTLASKPLREAGAGVSSTTRLFNAQLDLEDGQASIHPYLAEALPQLNTDSWRVHPDGRMETTYRLRPGLTWHDGTPFAAADFAFAWRVLANPAFGVAGTRPLSLIEDVVAPDARTLTIRWRSLYPDASTLRMEFQAFPRHVLERPLEQDDPDSFLINAYWNMEYVGLGPYRLERWEPGAFIEAVAFDGHALGRPKIERLRLRFIPDENTALTTLLAEEVQYATGRSLRFEHAQVLKREWGPRGKGNVILTPDTSRYTSVQFRPDLASPRAIHDLRVRKAIAYAIDRQALNDGIFEGDGSMSDTFLTKYSRYDRLQDMDRALVEVDRAITHYPFDLRRAEDLLAEAGSQRGGDGVQTSAGGERLSMEVWSDAGPQYEREQAILADTWRRAGIESRVFFVPPARLRDGQFRSSFPSLHTTSSSRLRPWPAQPSRRPRTATRAAIGAVGPVPSTIGCGRPSTPPWIPRSACAR